MGLANMFGTMMATAHDLMLNTVFFLMAVIILAGAFTSLLSEFGIVSIANRILSPFMKPFCIFGKYARGMPHSAHSRLCSTVVSTA